MPLYDAFLSYSHAKDKPIAATLQSVVQTLGKPWYKRRALRVFRDDTSLSATPQLWPSIEKALSESRYLILLPSPKAAASPWIAREVEYWLAHKNPEALFIGLTAGELAWNSEAGDFDWSPSAPLPKLLKGRFASEPKWVDLRAYRDGTNPRNANFIELGADFAAAVRGMPKEDLLSQEVRQQSRALTLATAAAAALLVFALVAAASGVAAWRKAQRAERNFRLAKATVDRLVFDIAESLRGVRGVLLARLFTGDGQLAFVAAINPDNASLTVVPAAALAPKQRSLEIWLVAPGGAPHSLGLIDPSQRKTITLSNDLLDLFGNDGLLAVTAEPQGGSQSGQPTGPMIAQGTLALL